MSRLRLVLVRLGLHSRVDAHADEGDRYALSAKPGNDGQRGHDAPDESPSSAGMKRRTPFAAPADRLDQAWQPDLLMS
ncbi:MAG: hypothetical protein ACXWXO_01245 [Nocardioides sp.]